MCVRQGRRFGLLVPKGGECSPPSPLFQAEMPGWASGLKATAVLMMVKTTILVTMVAEATASGSVKLGQ